MLRHLIGLLCCLLTISAFADEEPPEKLIPSTPDQLAALTSEPDYLIGGLISPMGGQPLLRQTDLVVQGAQNIALTRIYIPPYIPRSFPRHKHNQGEYDKKHLSYHLKQNYKGWQLLPHLRLEFNPHLKEVRLCEPSGATLDYRICDSQTTLASPQYAICNVAGEQPGGRYDPRNIRISLHDNNLTILVDARDGSVRTYRYKRLAIRNYFLFLLQKEVLPNGKILKYRYDDLGQLLSIESMDPQERYVYATLSTSGSSCERITYRSSSGVSVDYGYQSKSISWNIKEKHKHVSIKEKGNRVLPPILTSVSSPCYRHETLEYCDSFLLNTYSGENHVFKAHYSGFGECPYYRVGALSLPVGSEDSFQQVYEMHYEPPLPGEREGSTTVKQSDGTSTVYHFSKNLLNTAIQYFSQEGVLRKEKRFSWTDNNWLTSITMQDGQGNLLYQKSFEYDAFGNPTLELFIGDLTGNSTQESYVLRKEFSQDGRNLLLKEEYEDGKAVCYSYLSNTNLLTVKLTKEGDRILLREFFTYDDCNNLIQSLSDDGQAAYPEDLSGVTQRTITNSVLRQQQPFLHLPEWIEEKYLQEGQEKLLSRKHLAYDQYGNVADEENYDADGCLVYIIHRKYNERGDLLSETNPLSQSAYYAYDARGRRSYETNFSQRVQKTLHYDLQGRLREKIELGDDGVIHAVSTDYDFYDRLIHKTDPFQNSTSYTYDTLVSRVIKTDFPPIASVDGYPTNVTTSATYDSFGRELTQTDANGNSTHYRYNAYGSKSEILHPNGGREQFRYAKNGKLVSHTDRDGLTILYENDILGRVLSKTYRSTDGTRLAQETFTYSGFHLLSETDKEGHLTQYTYDGAGRKTAEEFCGRITEFIYDSLGRLATTCKRNGNNTLLTHYKRDLEGKLLEEVKTDLLENTLSKIAYSYDLDGNQQTITRYIHGKEVVDTFYYDSFGRRIQYRDSEGYATTTTYNEAFINALNQRVLQTTTTDPHNVSTLETQDALTRTIKVETLDRDGRTISCRELIHDPQGNLSYRKDHVYENNRFRNTQIIQYTHTPDHQIASMTRAFGTPNARATTYTYFPSGKTASKTLPDGQTLIYSYHPLGFMSRLDTADGAIHHSFEYDRLGRLKYALDENQNSAITRQVDPFGQVTQETFLSGLEIKKEYDDFNRPLFLKINGQGDVHYTYDPLFLRKVTRLSNRGETLYAHSYEEYDWSGNLVSENLIGNLGHVQHVTTPRRQKAVIFSPYFTQQCEYDAVGNLRTNVVDGIEQRYAYDSLSQLSSEDSSHQSDTYVHDSLYNRIQKNGAVHEINDLNELRSQEQHLYSYDSNGNLILNTAGSDTAHFEYDPLNRLIEITSETKKINYIYDPLGRRLCKTINNNPSQDWEEQSREYYIYDDQNEIGAIDAKGALLNLRILGLEEHKDAPLTISIEINGEVFAPLLDVQGSIRRLINPKSLCISESYDFNAFGNEIHGLPGQTYHNPLRFASKRFDKESGLIYFGTRYYDPVLARWMTIDPAEFLDSVNLYQYALNNPFKYSDPRGESLLGFLCGIVQILAGGAIMASGAMLEIATFGGYTFALGFHEAAGLALMTSGCSQAMYNANDLSFEKRSSRPDPDPLAEGNPHTIIEKPGSDGQYTTHNGDGTFKQYRGSGKSHGDIPRPNVKENKNNQSPRGPKPGNSTVREPRPDEIPKGK